MARRKPEDKKLIKPSYMSKIRTDRYVNITSYYVILYLHSKQYEKQKMVLNESTTTISSELYFLLLLKKKNSKFQLLQAKEFKFFITMKLNYSE